MYFFEFFAGGGTLTKEVAKMGIRAAQPDDLLTGGMDFTDKNDIKRLKTALAETAASGSRLLLTRRASVPHVQPRA